MKILLDENASVGVTNRAGKTPSNIAQEQRNKYILEILTREEEKKSPKSFFNYLLRDPVSFAAVFTVVMLLTCSPFPPSAC